MTLVGGLTVRHVVDAFIQAVEEARRELVRREGREVSIRELIRRAGFPESRRAGVYYHLNPRIDRSRRGHQVPADIVAALAGVLPITEEELARAARVAAGFQAPITDRVDLPLLVARFVGDQEVDEREREEVADRIMEVILEERRKRRRESGPDAT